MKQISTSLLLVSAIIIFFSACKKSDKNPDLDESNKKTVVHVIGKVWGGDNFLATYWKDGVATSLTQGNGEAYVGEMSIVGQDVYIAGYEYNGDNPVAAYWKNGVETKLTADSITSYCKSIDVVGNDVFVSGYIKDGNRTVAPIGKMVRLFRYPIVNIQLMLFLSVLLVMMSMLLDMKAMVQHTKLFIGKMVYEKTFH